MKNYATEVLLSRPHERELVYSRNADSKESDDVTKLTKQEQLGGLSTIILYQSF